MSVDDIRLRLSEVRPVELTAYLEASGWQREPGRSTLTTLWHRREQQFYSAEVLVPMSKELKDFDDQLVDALESIAKFEERPLADVFDRTSTYFSDLYSIRVIHADTEEGTIPLNDGIMLNLRARDLLAASAMSARQKRRHFDGKRTLEARDFLDTLRLGQTKFGSYIVNVLAPVVPLVAPQQELETTSMTRIVTSTLQSGLSALRSALDAFTITQNPEVFEHGIEAGVSANLCDALIGLSGSDRNREFEISIRTALSEAASEVPMVFRFDPSTVANIAFASTYYKEDYVIEDVTIQGHVKRLDRPAGEENGTVTIDATIRGVEKHVAVELGPDNYLQAVSAHKDLVIVECHGDVHVKARTARMLNPTGFRVFRSGDLF
jgi:hypothetical protein